jgi:hypothetical protein
MKEIAMTNEVVNETATPKARKQRKRTAPQLVCIITGKSRITTMPYLIAKANRLGLNTSDLKKFYICKEAVNLLKTNTIEWVLSAYNAWGWSVRTPGVYKGRDISEIIAMNTKKRKVTKQARAKAPAIDVEVVTVETLQLNGSAELVELEAMVANSFE